MLQKNIFWIVVFSACMFVSEAYAGKVELTTYYPSPDGRYMVLRSTQTTCFATTPGYNVGFGTPSPTNIAATSGADLTITGSIIQQDWQNASLVSSWANYGNGYDSASYFLDKSGMVHLRGLVRSGTIGATIFTLPAGYRPSGHVMFACSSYTTAYVPTRVDVYQAGEVYVVTGGNAFLSLDNISFRAAGY